jgi:hypothetical protein
MALLTTAYVKSVLEVRTSAKDAYYDTLRAAAERCAETWCGRQFAYASRAEYLATANTRGIVLRHRPVYAITSLHLDFNAFYGTASGAFGADTLLTPGSDYALDLDYSENGIVCSQTGIVYRINGFWPERGRVYYPGKLTAETSAPFGNIKVVYTSGYATATTGPIAGVLDLPDDLRYAIVTLIAFMSRTAKLGGQPIQSERIGDYSYDLGRFYLESTPELGSCRQILTRYRDISIGNAP